MSSPRTPPRRGVFAFPLYPPPLPKNRATAGNGPVLDGDARGVAGDHLAANASPRPSAGGVAFSFDVSRPVTESFPQSQARLISDLR